MNKVGENKKSTELWALNKKFFQEEQEEVEALKQKEAEDSFYQKLVDGFECAGRRRFDCRKWSG